MRHRLTLLAAVMLFLTPRGSEAVSFVFESTTPDTNVDVRFTADLTIVGDDLMLVLTNDSLNHVNGPSPSLNPGDLLTSFYFDIFDGTNRPTMALTGATGDVCLYASEAEDDCSVVNDEVPGGSDESDLSASVANDDGWQFLDGLSLQFGADTLTFGIGTAGNNSLTPNGFMGSVVDGLDFGIYADDPSSTTTKAGGLDGKYLVLNSISFTFSGLTGFTEADIADEVVFGLGTQPDSTGFVPEPSLLLGLGVLGVAWRGRRSFDS